MVGLMVMPDPGQAAGHVTKFCGDCGQSLLIPTSDLTRSVRCPRCRALHNVGELIDKSTPIAAVPASERPRDASSPANVVPVLVPQPTSAERQVSRGLPTEVQMPWHQAYADTVAIPASHLPNAEQVIAPELREEPAIVPPVAAVSEPAAIANGASEQEGTILKLHSGHSTQNVLPATATPTPTPVGALDRAAQGVAVAVAAASRTLEFADRLDTFFYGRRAKILVVSAGLVAFAPTLKGQLQWPWLPPIAIAIFLFVLSVLSLARVAMLRDEDGRWVPALGIVALKGALIDLAETFQRFRDSKRNQRQIGIGRLLIALALMSLAVRAVCDLIEVDFNWPAEIDWLAFFVGALLWLLGFRATRKLGTQSSLYVDPARNPEQAGAVASAFANLPEVIDCRDSASVKAMVNRAGHPLAAQLISATSIWRPRPTSKEKGYQRSYKRHLNKLLPECEAIDEVPLRKLGVQYSGRVDFVVGNCVLVEMKRKLNTSTGQKLVGQIRMYIQLRESNKPVVAVLLLCETPPEWAMSFLAPQIQQLRREGHAVVALTARQ